MFVDYYAILELSIDVDAAAIKKAFRNQAFKWHPDVNPNKDTTEIMKAINEAYLILKDQEARIRYDKIYREFKAQQKEKTTSKQPYSANQAQEEASKKQHYYSNYEVKDAVLKTWMERAKAQAITLAQQTIEDFRGMTAAGIKGVAKGAGEQFLAQIAVSFIFLFVFALAKSCS